MSAIILQDYCTFYLTNFLESIHGNQGCAKKFDPSDLIQISDDPIRNFEYPIWFIVFGSDIRKKSNFRIGFRSDFFPFQIPENPVFFLKKKNEIWQQAEGSILLTPFQCTKLLNCRRDECMVASCQVAQKQPLINYVCNVDCRLPLSTN